MDTQGLNKKLELIQWLSALEDKLVIEKLIEFKKIQSKDWWQSISDDERASIEKGIIEAENHELTPHSSTRKLYEKWL